MISPAVSTLGKIMIDPNAPAASRVRAATSILQLSQWFEFEDLETRLAALERDAKDSEKS